MLNTILLIGTLAMGTPNSPDSIPSGVYHWKSDKGKDVIMSGSARDFSFLSVQSWNLTSEADVHADSLERLWIIRDGTVFVKLGDSTHTLSRGSVILLLPGNSCVMKSEGARLYEMKYRAAQRKYSVSGQSMVVNWTDVPFKPHDKGGIRNFFQGPTAMTKRFEMHVTTLNAGLKSHEPHRHRAAEIVLLIQGSGEMFIAGKEHPVKDGDLIFLESNVLHAITNNGKVACTYFAFQFE